jgi:hypothetical protein
MQDQDRQQRPLLGRAQRHRAIVIDNLKRPENAKFHRFGPLTPNATTGQPPQNIPQTPYRPVQA